MQCDKWSPLEGSAGNGPPESRLWYTCTFHNFSQALIEGGRAPLSLLLDTSKTPMSTKAPISFGRVPVRFQPDIWLHDKQRGAGVSTKK
jgi:hypothetical protein